jgi:predicted MFS family arabinose efflux permease
MAFADASIVVLGLPAIYGELNTTVVQASFVITLYAVVVTVVALVLAVFARRSRPGGLALAGLVLFAVGSTVSGIAGNIGVLFVGRGVQGLGGALALVGSLPVLALFTASPGRGRTLWVTAAAIGTAVGPALGGVLTQVFTWRAIFLVQVPVAIAAIVAVATPTVRTAPAERIDRLDRRSLVANAGEVLTFAALVGALFLGVLLLVVVWGYAPIAGAAVVSALPAASFAVRPVAARLRSDAAGAAGAVLLAAGLAGLAFLPGVNGWLAALAFALCGAGMGLALAVLAPATFSDGAGLLGSASRSVAARHAGLVVGLVLIAPVLAGNLQARGNDAALAGTNTMLEAQLPLRQKVPLAWALRNEIQRTPDGEVPDLGAVFEAQGAGKDEGVASVQDDLVGTIEAILTRAFRSSFLIAALLALAAIAPLLLVAARPARGQLAGWPAIAAGVLVVGGLVFITAEWAGGAQEFGTYEAADPCTASSSTYPGKGIDATVQRIALGGLNGAACELGTSREELVLSLDPRSGIGDVTWDRKTVAQAMKSGTSRAIDDAVDRGTLPGWAGSALRFVVDRAPIEWFLQRLPFIN